MKIRSAIEKLTPYKPPLEGRNPREFTLLDFNESPFPLPPHVRERLVEYIQGNTLHVYPAYGDFLEHLAAYTGVTPEQLIVTNGSDQAIDIILRCILDAGDEMVLAKPGFSMFFQIAGTLDASVISPFYSLDDMRFPMDQIVRSVTEKTRLIVVINPNNPTGTSASPEQLRQLLTTFPDIAVLVDEAYYEFTGKTCVSLVNEFSNLVVIRTFSKAFAIPSLRLGYALGNPDFIQQLYKIRGPYDVNMMAIVSAKAQLDNPEPWKEAIRHVMTEAKPALEHFFQTHQVKYYPGEAHFMLVVPENLPEAVNYLKDHGILVRPMHPPIGHMFRVNAGTMEQTQKFIQIYKKYLELVHD
ncbi:MAG: histidinol-phosphate aminotransferase family protein [SAR324 cluster bacterium]|nr:histidinol-phosphate aminotransferase family protein [SAR324 cluster bacterium]